MSLNDENPYGEFKITGCTDKTAINYNENATEEDGSCKYSEDDYIIDINDDCETIVKKYKSLIGLLIISFISFLIIILLYKNKNKDIENIDDNQFVIYLN